MRHFTVKVPATTANLGPGFDVFGMALDMFNEFEVSPENELSIEVEGEGRDTIPRNDQNLIYQSFCDGFRKAGTDPTGIRIVQRNRIPLDRGLGSSATAILGGLLAASVFLGKRLSRQDVLNLAVEKEGHPDNVIAAFYGGVVINFRPNGGFRGYTIIPPEPLKVALAIPEITISTDKARTMLPESYALSDVVENLRNVSLLAIALQSGRYELLATAMEDRIHEPYRKKLIPGYDRIKRAALDLGAFGAAISGSGPTVAALCGKNGEEVAAAMGKVFEEENIPCACMVVNLSSIGAHIIEHNP